MPATKPGFTALTSIPRALGVRYKADPPPTYRQVRRLILDGLVDTEIGPSNRLMIRNDDLSRVAALLGLVEPAT